MAKTEHYYTQFFPDCFYPLAHGLPPQTLVQVSRLEPHISLSLTGVSNAASLLSSETKI